MQTSLGRAQLRWAYVRAGGVRALLLGVGWWTLSAGDPDGLAFGVVAVAAATATSLALTAPSRVRLRPMGGLRLIAAFLWGSIRGGVDVARRALSPTLTLSPGLVRHRIELPSGRMRHLFTTMVSLMPGTQNAALEGQDLIVHVLVRRDDVIQRQLAALEAKVAAAFTRGGA